MRCPVPECGREFRKGKRAHVPIRGKLRERLVCLTCAKKSIRVAMTSAPEPCSCCPESDLRPATVCARCMNDAVHAVVTKALEPYWKAIRNLHLTYKKTGHPAAVGLEMAADMLAEGRTFEGGAMPAKRETKKQAQKEDAAPAAEEA